MRTYYVGIDTGTKKCGVAEVADDGEITLVNAGVYDLESMHGKDLDSRMRGLFYDIAARIQQILYRIPRGMIVVGVEAPWAGKNMQTALTLGEACGIIRAALLCKEAETIYRIAPKEAKKALTGDGRASKLEVQRHVRMQFGQDLSEDAADAVAVALAARIKYMEGRLHDS